MNIFTNIPDTAKHVLFFGYLKNCMGSFKTDLSFNIENIIAIKKHCIDNNGKLDIVVLSDEDFNYICNKSDGMIMQVANFFGNQKENLKKLVYNIKVWKYTKTFDADNIINYIKNNCLKNNMGYDYIIQNPPYSKSLHLDFLTTGLDLLSKKGKMTIIEPATWLINVRKNGKASKYDEIKKMLDKHVYKVVIENYNKEFGTGLYVPFSVTYIDMDNEYNDIEFICCGDRKIVHNLYDCNMIGDYEMIHSILNKCQAYGDMMEDHVYKPGKSKTNDDTWYCKFCDIISVSGCYMSSPSCTTTNPYNANQMWKSHKNGDFLSAYIAGSIHHVENNLYNSLPFARKAGNYSTGEVKYSDKIANCIYGSKSDLENWKYFVFNNKLPLFINICLIIDQNNTVKPYIPFIVDNQYSDIEIFEKLNISKDEIELINNTLEKYSRNSQWFKRYMCGTNIK